MNKIVILEKHISVRLSDHLTSNEVRCRCAYDSCHTTQVSQRLIDSFERFRTAWGSSITVTSGFRCQVHNHNVGGKVASKHKLGFALDLYPNNGDLDNFYIAAKKFFDVVVLYSEKKFIHCHNIPVFGVLGNSVDHFVGLLRNDYVTKQD